MGGHEKLSEPFDHLQLIEFTQESLLLKSRIFRDDLFILISLPVLGLLEHVCKGFDRYLGRCHVLALKRLQFFLHDREIEEVEVYELRIGKHIV